MTDRYAAAELWGATPLANGGTRFRVWAPSVQQIALVLVDRGELLRPMHSIGDGTYELLASDVSLGERYFYRLDDRVDRPDPASRYQPNGVHAASQVVSSDFAWTDSVGLAPAWRDFVIYELHVGTFTKQGTLEAIIAELDSLVQLGVTAIQLMPLAQFPGQRNWGYDGVHPFAVQNSYGGPLALKRLVDACHQRGLAVILDVVYNHLGPEGNYLAEFGPYFTDRYQTPWGQAINFDGPGSDVVRDYFIANALRWVTEFHIDGLRLDATHAIFDRSPRHFMSELAEAVHQRAAELGRRVVVIAENNADDPRITTPVAQGGYGLDAQLLDEFQRSLHALVTGERQGFYADFGRVEHFAKAYGFGFVLTGQYSHYRQAPWGTSGSHLPADAYVVYSQCHDSVGNRPASERPGQLVDFESLKLAAAATLLSPSVPLLFMGEEYAEPAPFYYFVSHLDPQLNEAIRAGRQREFARFHWTSEPPSPDARQTFAASKLNRSLCNDGRHRTLWDYYRELLRLRREHAAVRQADRAAQQLFSSEDPPLLIANRETSHSAVCIAINFGATPLAVTAGLPTTSTWHVAFDSATERWGGTKRDASRNWQPHDALQLAARSCMMLVRDDG